MANNKNFAKLACRREPEREKPFWVRKSSRFASFWATRKTLNLFRGVALKSHISNTDSAQFHVFEAKETLPPVCSKVAFPLWPRAEALRRVANGQPMKVGFKHQAGNEDATNLDEEYTRPGLLWRALRLQQLEDEESSDMDEESTFSDEDDECWSDLEDECEEGSEVPDEEDDEANGEEEESDNDNGEAAEEVAKPSIKSRFMSVARQISSKVELCKAMIDAAARYAPFKTSHVLQFLVAPIETTHNLSAMEAPQSTAHVRFLPDPHSCKPAHTKPALNIDTNRACYERTALQSPIANSSMLSSPRLSQQAQRADNDIAEILSLCSDSLTPSSISTRAPDTPDTACTLLFEKSRARGHAPMLPNRAEARQAAMQRHLVDQEAQWRAAHGYSSPTARALTACNSASWQESSVPHSAAVSIDDRGEAKAVLVFVKSSESAKIPDAKFAIDDHQELVGMSNVVPLVWA